MRLEPGQADMTTEENETPRTAKVGTWLQIGHFSTFVNGKRCLGFPSLCQAPAGQSCVLFCFALLWQVSRSEENGAFLKVFFQNDIS